MKRIKALFNSIRTLGRSPDRDISAAWDRVKGDMIPVRDDSNSTDGDRYLIEQIIFGALDEAVAYLKKQGEQPKA